MLGIDIDPVLIKRANEKNEHNNITFICLNFMDNAQKCYLHEYLKKFNSLKFSAVFCFSVTMWIHLNNGDDGLNKFLIDITTISNAVLVEPQPWKCYKSAVMRMKKSGSSFPCFKELTITKNVEDVIEKTIEDQKFQKVLESDRTKWERKLVIFKRK